MRRGWGHGDGEHGDGDWGAWGWGAWGLEWGVLRR